MQHDVPMHLPARTTASARAAARASLASRAASTSPCAATPAAALARLVDGWILHEADERHVRHTHRDHRRVRDGCAQQP